MIAHHFKGQHRVLEAPKDHDHERDGEVYGLPVRFEKQGEATFCISMWKPTADELAILIAGGAVRLSVMGGQPPVALDAVSHEELVVPA